MAREIPVEGTVIRTQDDTWESADGVLHPGGRVVLMGEHDRIDVEADFRAPSAQLAKIMAFVPGTRVRLLVEVRSGGDKKAEPKFMFKDDLSPVAAK